MTRLLSRSLLGFLVGACSGMGALAAVYAYDPAITMGMDRGTAAISGLYDAERAGQETYAWTGREADLNLPGLDRRLAWSCTVRLRGGRADPDTLPDVLLTVDGVIASSVRTTNDYQDITVRLPPKPGASVTSRTTVTLTSSKTFQPGPADPRVLGVMVDRWTCAPADQGLVRPPRRALVAAAEGGAAFGAALVLVGLSLPAAAAAGVAIGCGQAMPVAWGVGMFTPYVARVPQLAFWIAAILVASIRAFEWFSSRRLHTEARFVGIFTAAMLYLKLLALLHPSKTPIDAVFHAHRLMWVLDGRFFFTQAMPSGVQFPYAIGLYIFAAPWSLLTHDYVLLLRIVVSAAEATGGLLLYLLVSRVWGDRLAGAIAAVFFSVVPRAFEIVGNANMTNAFGQAIALATVAAAVLWRLDRRAWWQVAAFWSLTAFALLCHVSTLALLSATLAALAGLYWWRGRPELRVTALTIMVALAIAVLFSVAVYYGHFADAFRSAVNVRASSAPAAASVALPQTAMGLSGKVIEAARLSVAAVGWPMLLLAAVGAVPWWRRGRRDRLSLAVAAWIAVYVVFVASVVVAPVGTSFLRYAAEFITRVTLATYPAVVVLASVGAATALRRGWVSRLPAMALAALACAAGLQSWLDWLR